MKYATKPNPNRTGTDIRMLIAEIQGVSPATRALMRKQDNAIKDFETGLERARKHLGQTKHYRLVRGHVAFSVHLDTLSAKCDVELSASHQMKIDRMIQDAGLTIIYTDEEQPAWMAVMGVTI